MGLLEIINNEVIKMGYQNIVFPPNSIFLITGGAGFIGSNISEILLKKGHFVKVLDNLSTGCFENIAELMNNKRFSFICGDIRDYNTCYEVSKGVNYVIHLAAWGSVPRSIDMPLLYEDINIRGTLNMMEASRQNGVERFVYASSSSVYGNSTELPKREGREGEVLSPYALTKRCNEEYGKLYKKIYGLNTYGLRFFNVFGRHQNPDGIYAAVIPKFIKQILCNVTPVIDGDGRQSRDFTYIENVVEGCLRACAASPEAAGESYNIGNGGREYLIDVYYDICKALNKKIEPIFGPGRKGDIRDSNADISKAREKLGYNPSYDFTQGIQLAIEWYTQNLLKSDIQLKMEDIE